MSSYADRLAALREQLKADQLDGFVVPLTDEHMSEYVGSYAQRLEWLTGFKGSAGSAAVLPEEAAIFTDGRYTIQSAEQTDTAVVTPVRMEDTPLERWIEQNLPAGGKLGYDPWLHTVDGVARLEKAAAAAGGSLVALSANPVDALWSDRPAAPSAPVKAHPAAYAGETPAAKLDRIRKAGVEKITFAWAGDATRGQRHYYRVQGPTFLIEFDNTQNNANHIHSVWRDFQGDFGRDLLREHLKTSAH